MSIATNRQTHVRGLPPGSVIAGKYRIDRVLAEGGMGVIYQGWHLVLDQPIAVKVMRPELADRPEGSLRFLNEARAAARLKGANVARVLDSGAIATGPCELLYIVLEYLEGADLRTVLDQEGALPVERAVDFVLQVCEALAEAHTAGIVHRDVKPENLFLTRQPDGSEIIKLLDFGISKRLDADPGAQQSEAQSLGSPHYMSPEQMSSPGTVDERGDIWSLAVVTYELLTFAVPFDGDTLATVCGQVLGKDPEPLSVYCEDVPSELEELILSCLHKDRNFRPASVREFAEAIAHLGSSKALESVQRVQRIFDRRNSEPAIDVDVDLSEMSLNIAAERPTQALSPAEKGRGPIDSIDSMEVEVPIPARRRPRVTRRIAAAAAAAAAAAVLAVALPEAPNLGEMKDRTARVMSPLGAQAKLSAGRVSDYVSQRLRSSETEPAKALPQTSRSAYIAGARSVPLPMTEQAPLVSATQTEASSDADRATRVVPFSKSHPKGPTAQRRSPRTSGPARTRSGASSEVSSTPAALDGGLRGRLIAPQAEFAPSPSSSRESRSDFALRDRYALDSW